MCRGFDPFFWPSGYQTRSFWSVFSHPPTQKRSFGYKSSQNSIFLAPKYHFPLDLFGSNFQWPTAHTQQFSDRVPPRAPIVYRSGHELFPRINWKWQRLNVRRILIPTSVSFVPKGTDDKSLQLVQMSALCRLSLRLDGLVYWCICASLAIQRSTRRNDDVGVTWKPHNFNVMVVMTLLLHCYSCCAMHHYTIQ